MSSPIGLGDGHVSGSPRRTDIAVYGKASGWRVSHQIISGKILAHLGPERGQGSEKVQRGVRGRAALVGPSTSFGFRSSLFTLPSQTPPSPVPR